MNQPVFKIINCNQANQWRSLLEKCELNDIHFFPDYLDLFAEYLAAEGLYVFYGDENNYILAPFLKKPLLKNEIEEKYFDLVSPWYYGGPVYHFDDQTVALDWFKGWRDGLDNYCVEYNIVSEFQRLNPMTENHLLYRGEPGLFFNRKIAYVDLRKSLDDINNNYAYHVRKNLKTAEAAGLQLIYSKTKADWEKFIEIYLLSMDQKEAGSFYYFNEHFYNKIFTDFYNELEIFRVELNGKTIAATVVLGKYGILHDYLRGSSREYLSLRPNDFMIHNIISWAKANGYSYYSLGGGHSTDPNDSLLKFKGSFSPDKKDFFIYKKIHNLTKYNQLCLLAGQKEELLYEQASFFPEYLKS